jgi:hypothetical protein
MLSNYDQSNTTERTKKPLRKIVNQPKRASEREERERERGLSDPYSLQIGGVHWRLMTQLPFSEIELISMESGLIIMAPVMSLSDRFLVSRILSRELAVEGVCTFRCLHVYMLLKPRTSSPLFHLPPSQR